MVKRSSDIGRCRDDDPNRMMMESDPRSLGVLVTAPDRLTVLLDIARSALLKNITVQIHLTGSGVLLCRQPEFTHLCAQSRVYVCLESARAFGVEEMLRELDPPLLFPCRNTADLLLACDRRLVF